MIQLDLHFFENLQTKILSSAFLVVKELKEHSKGNQLCYFHFGPLFCGVNCYRKDFVTGILFLGSNLNILIFCLPFQWWSTRKMVSFIFQGVMDDNFYYFSSKSYVVTPHIT